MYMKVSTYKNTDYKFIRVSKEVHKHLKVLALSNNTSINHLIGATFKIKA